jgi:hypothetical protein
MKIFVFVLIYVMFFLPIASIPNYEHRWSEECGCEDIIGPPLLISDLTSNYVEIYSERDTDPNSRKTLEIIYELLLIQQKIAVRDGFF